MKQSLFGVFLVLLLAACGNAKKDSEGSLNDKKARLEELRKEQQTITTEITTLQKEIARLDTSAAARTGNAKLVAVTPLLSGAFNHYVDLQGRVDATNISYVAPPNGMGGIVKALYVRQGDVVRKGQVLARLDDQVLRQQMEPLRVQLNAAEDTYRRTKNLWDQGIGTYQQVLTAQTQVENLKKNIGIIQKQVSMMTVTAPNTGVADVVNLRVGEMFTGNTPTGPQIRIVNTSSLKVIAEVPENYLGRVGAGSKVRITFPNISRVIEGKVSVAGKTIDVNKRTFYIEIPIPANAEFKPNQIAVVQVQDYSASAAVTIPVNTLQNDEKGKFVMIAVAEKGKLFAHKRYVVTGELYQDRLEIRSGLQGNEQLITEGFQNLYEGQLITLK